MCASSSRCRRGGDGIRPELPREHGAAGDEEHEPGEKLEIRISLQADAAVCGGITEFRRVAATAASYGVKMCPHWFHDLHIHLVASISNGDFVEFFPDAEVLNFRRLIDRQLDVKDGALVLPETPGLGFDFDESAVSSFAIEPWHRISRESNIQARP